MLPRPISIFDPDFPDVECIGARGGRGDGAHLVVEQWRRDDDRSPAAQFVDALEAGGAVGGRGQAGRARLQVSGTEPISSMVYMLVSDTRVAVRVSTDFPRTIADSVYVEGVDVFARLNELAAALIGLGVVGPPRGAYPFDAQRRYTDDIERVREAATRPRRGDETDPGVADVVLALFDLLHTMALRLALSRPAAPPTPAPAAAPTPTPAPAAPTASDLPEELWSMIVAAIETDDPCAEIAKLCQINRQWRDWCRSGWLFDEASRRLGWYGQSATWARVQAHFRAHAELDAPLDPKGYFVAVCAWKRRVEAAPASGLQAVPVAHPAFGAMARLAVQRNGYVLGYVPTDHADYGAIARLAVQRKGSSLYYVPRDRDDYGALARLAVQNDGRVLRLVPRERDDYGAIARIAVGQTGEALEHVPHDRTDFGEIARLAVESGDTGIALFYVPPDRADFGALARLAVRRLGFVLKAVPSDRADFEEIARIAVQNAGHALSYVSTDRDGFGAIAQLAVQNDGDALRFVPADRADYGAIARLAVQNDRGALRHVPAGRDDYDEIEQLAIQMNARPAPRPPLVAAFIAFLDGEED